MSITASQPRPRVFGIIGWKNSGKTTLVTKLITRLTKQGYRVATIKHAHHDFDIDHSGRDSHRHRLAGAQQVLVSSSTRWALIHELNQAPEPSLSDHLARLAPCDLVLIEGYKTEGHPKLEAHRVETGKSVRALEDKTVLALASNTPKNPNLLALKRPIFDLDDVESITGFILEQTGLARIKMDAQNAEK